VLLGYVTNGFASHALEDAIDILAEIGYRSVAISLDHNHLNPFQDEWEKEAERIRALLSTRGLRCTIETGARFLLDPRRKHHPTLVSRATEDRDVRVDYLKRAIDVGVAIGADSVSLWSGAADDDAENSVVFDRLRSELEKVLAHAESKRLPVAFEPEPGMFIERMEHFEKLHETLKHPSLGLTLDIGHVHCLDDGDLAEHFNKWRDILFNVHLEDMVRGRHEHLDFGEGEIDFSQVIASLDAVGYCGPVHVELSRHSHNAPVTAERAYRFLTELHNPNVFDCDTEKNA
jgi:L-ribulose-5-phosphate 3-epimerase